MDSLQKFTKRLNFRTAAKVYLIVSAVMLMLIISLIAYETKDKIHMAVDYKKASDTFEKQGLGDKLNSRLTKLGSDSKDIVNTIVLDKDNNVLFKFNNNLIGENSKLTLTPYESNRNYLQDNINKNILYRVVDEENILLNINYITSNEKLTSDIDKEFYYERDLSSRDIYLINYIADRNTKSKVFIIRTITPIPYAETLLELTGTVLGLMLIIYWIGLALWVYKDADAKRNNPALWGGLVLLTNIAGLIVYLMYKQNSTICHKCGVMQNRENIFCTHCGNRLNEQCSQCGSIVNSNEYYCGKCGKKL
ncbi:MAG: zinc ribbon domain-containing protein [Clostridiaceae bacterium]